jgi:hypothetical protein
VGLGRGGGERQAADGGGLGEQGVVPGVRVSSGVVSEDRKPSAEAIVLGSLIRDLRLAHGWSQGRLVSATRSRS